MRGDSCLTALKVMTLGSEGKLNATSTQKTAQRLPSTLVLGGCPSSFLYRPRLFNTCKQVKSVLITAVSTHQQEQGADEANESKSLPPSSWRLRGMTRREKQPWAGTPGKEQPWVLRHKGLPDAVQAFLQPSHGLHGSSSCPCYTWPVTSTNQTEEMMCSPRPREGKLRTKEIGDDLPLRPQSDEQEKRIEI